MRPSAFRAEPDPGDVWAGGAPRLRGPTLAPPPRKGRLPTTCRTERLAQEFSHARPVTRLSLPASPRLRSHVSTSRRRPWPHPSRRTSTVGRAHRLSSLRRRGSARLESPLGPSPCAAAAAADVTDLLPSQAASAPPLTSGSVGRDRHQPRPPPRTRDIHYGPGPDPGPSPRGPGLCAGSAASVRSARVTLGSTPPPRRTRETPAPLGRVPLAPGGADRPFRVSEKEEKGPRTSRLLLPSHEMERGRAPRQVPSPGPPADATRERRVGRERSTTET